ncbi:MAG: hypothetical protein AAGD09_25740 [Cyanobacteria bacterium P01_F01_bin.56]
MNAHIEGLAQAAENSEERVEPADEVVAESSPEERSTVATVQQFFALTGWQEFEGQHYRLKMAGNQLSVEAKDGRGEVLSVDGEKVVSRLKSQDFRQFDAARELLISHLNQKTLAATEMQDLKPKDWEIE